MVSVFRRQRRGQGISPTIEALAAFAAVVADGPRRAAARRPCGIHVVGDDVPKRRFASVWFDSFRARAPTSTATTGDSRNAENPQRPARRTSRRLRTSRPISHQPDFQAARSAYRAGRELAEHLAECLVGLFVFVAKDVIGAEAVQGLFRKRIVRKFVGDAADDIEVGAGIAEIARRDGGRNTALLALARPLVVGSSFAASRAELVALEEVVGFGDAQADEIAVVARGQDFRSS